MRIAYICADRGVGFSEASGSSVHASAMIDGLMQRGASVDAFVSLGSSAATSLPCPVFDIAGDPLLERVRSRTAKALRDRGKEATEATEVYSLLLNQGLMAELDRHAGGADLIYERHSLWSLAGLCFARQKGIPYFLELNAPLSVQQREYRELELAEVAETIENIVLSSADLVLATSSALVDHAHACGASRRSTRIIPCGVSADLFDGFDDRRAPDSNRFVLGFVGSLKPWHGVEILMESFLRLHDLFDGYRLLIVGDGPMREWIESFCRDHGLESCVTMTGNVDHDSVGSYLAKMDVGLAPYPELPAFYFSPLKVWEYAAAGVPVVASASGEIADVLPHKAAALLHTPGRVGKVVNHVEKLRANPDLALRLARRARRIVRSRTWDRLASRVLKLAETRVNAASPSSKSD
jgi:glycosyltransferase involved in cell wall biosynthesis